MSVSTVTVNVDPDTPLRAAAYESTYGSERLAWLGIGVGEVGLCGSAAALRRLASYAFEAAERAEAPVAEREFAAR